MSPPNSREAARAHSWPRAALGPRHPDPFPANGVLGRRHRGPVRPPWSLQAAGELGILESCVTAPWRPTPPWRTHLQRKGASPQIAAPLLKPGAEQRVSSLTESVPPILSMALLPGGL